MKPRLYNKPVILETFMKILKIECEIFGISNDTKKSHENFKEENYKLPFKLLTDYKGKIKETAKLAERFLWFITWKSYIFTQ